MSSQRLYVLLVGFALVAMPGAVGAQGNADKDAEEEKRFKEFEKKYTKKLDELTNGRKTLAEKIKKLTAELSGEFTTNNAKLEGLKFEKGVDEVDLLKQADKLIDRQRTIMAMVDELDGLQRGPSSYNPAAQNTLREIQRELKNFSKFRNQATQLYQKIQRQIYSQPAQNRRAQHRPSSKLASVAVPGFDVGIVPRQELAGLTSGPIHDARRKIQTVAKLAWSESSLTIDRTHWQKQFGGRTTSDLRQLATEMLKAEGVPELLVSQDSNQQRVAQQQAGQLQGPMDLFHRINSAQTYYNGRRHYSSHGKFVGGGLKADLTWTTQDFDLFIAEQQEPGGMIHIWQRGGGALQIMVRSTNLTFDFRQNPKGDIRLVDVTDKVVQHRADSFREFYREHRDYVEQRFFPLLNSAGVASPLLFNDRLVRFRVASQLRYKNTEQAEEFQQLLAQLDSAEFTERESASEKLAAEYERFRTALQQEGLIRRLSLEVRSRIRNVSNTQNAFFAEVDRFIGAMQLIDDRPFLVQLLRHARDSEREAIAAHLKDVTGADLGVDADAWGEWLKQQASADAAS